MGTRLIGNELVLGLLAGQTEEGAPGVLLL